MTRSCAYSTGPDEVVDYCRLYRVGCLMSIPGRNIEECCRSLWDYLGRAVKGLQGHSVIARKPFDGVTRAGGGLA